MTSNVASELVFTRADETQTDKLILGENLIEMEFEEDDRDRFSDYIVAGHGRASGKAGDDQSAKNIASQKAEVKDPISRATARRSSLLTANGFQKRPRDT
jgi:prophage tail gpP-like protein